MMYVYLILAMYFCYMASERAEDPIALLGCSALGLISLFVAIFCMAAKIREKYGDR